MHGRAVLLLCGVLSAPSAIAADFIGKVIDSSTWGYTYGYGPSIVEENGFLHMFYCSTGSDTQTHWDTIRHSVSEDGYQWSAPTKILEASGGMNERAACDPSIVKFNRGDGDKYYLFYSGNIPGYETVMFVARADYIAGPYKKLTKRNTWEANPGDPKVILYPKQAVVTPWYGAGQQTVVVRDGRLYSWYSDDTAGYPGARESRIYFSSTTDPTSWPSGQQTNVASASVDVKWDPGSSTFVMYAVEPHHGVDSHLAMRRSADGINWSPVQWNVCDASCFPDYAHNVGVSGTLQGHLLGRSTIVAYGAPYDLNTSCGVCWPNWDLYAHYIDTYPYAALVPILGSTN